MLFQAYFDGSFNEETLCGGMGVAILRDGKVLETYSDSKENQTSSNKIELLALQLAITRLSFYGAKEVKIFGDHQGVINGLNKIKMKYYSIKERDEASRFLEKQYRKYSIRLDVFKALEQFDSYELVHIDHDFNALADSLAAKACGCLGWGVRNSRRRQNSYIAVPVQVNGGFRYLWRSETS